MTRKGPVLAVASVIVLLSSIPASAHVKWFCAYDVAGQPVGLENVLCPDFEMLIGVSILALLFGAILESTTLGAHMVRFTNVLASPIRAQSDLMLRATVGFFLVSLWNVGGVLLTPELKTTSTFVPWFQLALAACLLWRRTLPLVAAGVAGLYAVAIRDYGLFHMMDYPIFLGIGAYLAMLGLDFTPKRFSRLDVVRVMTAVTLLWASVEKWAYPEWSAPLFGSNPSLPFGVDQDFFMRAAGAVEFALAFSLLLGPLVRKVGAALLLMIFVSAVGPFGKIDAIGHSGIIAVLLMFMFEDTPVPVRPALPSWGRALRLDVAAGYAGALVATLALYYEVHAAMFGTTVL